MSQIVNQFDLLSNTISDREEIETDRKGGNINMYENGNIEFKEAYVPEMNKEVVAFSNTNGGAI